MANVDELLKGSVLISGSAGLGEILTASNTLNDEDGLGAVTYQWLRDGSAIPNATGGSYTLTTNDSGAVITVQARAIDGLGNVETMISADSRSFVITQSGVVQDGYVANGLVWIDVNDNGVKDAGEPWTLTDQGGNFSGLIGVGTLRIGPNPAGGSIDISTGKPFTGSFSAPSGSSVVNPLTTLVVAAGGDTTQILSALGLAPDVDLTNFDPIAAAMSEGEGAAIATYFSRTPTTAPASSGR